MTLGECAIDLMDGLRQMGGVGVVGGLIYLDECLIKEMGLWFLIACLCN